MIQVLANLRKSWISVITIIILLCIQAVADLSLPDYTSKIVNIGIQQGGIENSSPEVIRKSSMDDVLLFTEDDEKILDSYTLISKENLENKTGKNVEVLVEEVAFDGKTYVGRSYMDVPEIDGIVYINSKENLKLGEFTKTTVKDVSNYDLIAEKE